MNNTNTSNAQETRGWEIVKQLNANVPQCGNIEARRLLAEYIKLETARPSRLHSTVMSCAVKMATIFPEFHFVPFLDIWGTENIRPEDNQRQKNTNGAEMPSLAERITKAYAYSLLFHPGEHLEPMYEGILRPTLKKVFRLEEEDGQLCVNSYALATRVFQSDVRNRKMTFVTLLTPWGEELVAEVHIITQFSRLRYEDITNQMFKVLLRTTENNKHRIEAAIQSNENIEERFATSVGYVEHIDGNHHHIHVYDNESRHMVAKYAYATDVREGDYVKFVPVIPKDSNFKSAIITSVLQNGTNGLACAGAEAFGYRDVVVTYTNEEQGYCAWELLPEADGKVHPIVETNAKETQEPATKGYISKETLAKKVQRGSRRTEGSDLASSSISLPKKGDRLKVITFLKRGKDGKKRPVVVDYKR